MVDWIRDAETGELYPIETDFDYEVPAHLEIPEYMTIDYDKTKQMTITELQDQLIAAQNHIEAIESEKTSDNNSAVTVNEVFPEIVSKSGFKDFWDEFYSIIILLVVCFAFAAFGIFVFKDEIVEGLSNSPRYQTVAEQELEEKQAENEDKSPILYLLPPAISVLGIRCAINFMKHTIDGV